MIKLKNVVVDVPKTVGNVLLLTDVTPVYSYSNGIRTNEIIGYRYEVALPERHLDKLDVMIEGDKRIEAPQGNKPVEFDSLVLFVGWGRTGYEVKATAANIMAVTSKANK